MLALLDGMKKKLKWIFGALVVMFALLQLTNPARTNPPVVSDMLATNAPPPHVTVLLRAACYDCHSSETVWPWYAHSAPASWLVVKDVDEGRRHLNLSEWPSGDPARAAKKLDRMSEEIDYHEMPPKKIHLVACRCAALGRRPQGIDRLARRRIGTAAGAGKMILCCTQN